MKRLNVLAMIVVVFAMTAVIVSQTMRAEHEALRRICELSYDGIVAHDRLINSMPRDDETSAEGNSWRFQIQRLVEDVHNQPYELDAGWNAPQNRAMAERMPGPPFACLPSSNRAAVFAVTGPDTCWNAADAVRLSDLPPNYILFVAGIASDSHWMQPCDITHTQLQDIIAGPEAKGEFSASSTIWIGFADGNIAELNLPMDAAILHPFLQLSEARDADRNTLSRFLVNR
jgi:hypothetical protein